MSEIWTVGRALEWTRDYFERKGVESALISARWLLSDVSGLSYMELYTRFDRPLDKSELDKLHGFIERRVAGEPLQYITGSTDFYNVSVICRPGVLIPRPETEQLVAHALEYLKSLNKESMLIADIGTGSGCISCAIATEFPGAKIIATDISDEALSLAAANINKLGLQDQIELLKSDIGSNISKDKHKVFDLVISNPPYIPTKVLQDMPAEVTNFEPALALDGGADGLDIYRSIASWAYEALLPGGMLLVELHETCLDDAKNIAIVAGFEAVDICKDLAERQRFIKALKSRYS